MESPDAGPGSQGRDKNIFQHQNTIGNGYCQSETWDAPLCSGHGQWHSPNNQKAPQEYIQISLKQIETMLENPASVPKEQAQWAIFSSLSSRVHEEQRAKGLFYALWADLDSVEGLLFEDIVDRAGVVLHDFWAYTSRSATEEKPKSRIIAPLYEPVIGFDFVILQKILNDKLEAQGLKTDRTTERPGQVCYLPNRGKHYLYHKEQILEPIRPSKWAEEVKSEHDRREAEEAARQARAEISRAKATDRMKAGGGNPIEAFNENYPIPDRLSAYGYQDCGRGRWLSPNSESGNPGITLTDDQMKWLSAHESDTAIGMKTATGTMGDAFDLFCYYEHGNNRTEAVKAAGEMFGVKGFSDKDRREYAERKSREETETGFDDQSEEHRDVKTDQEIFMGFVETIKTKDPLVDAAYLTGELVEDILAAALPETLEYQLLKLISKKCNILVEMLTKKKPVEPTAEAVSQLEMVMQVIDEIGRENIFFACEFVWQWMGAGVWERREDWAVKALLQAKTTECGVEPSKNLTNSMVDLLKVDLYRQDHQFNTGPSAVNCLNCEIHWTGAEWEQRPHCKESYRTTQIPVVYDPDAPAPLFETFLDEITQGDDDKAILILEMFGYCLLTETSFEKFFMLIGPGANGKSVLLIVLVVLLGRSNVSAVSPAQFDSPFQRAHLLGKLANIVTELPEGCQLPDEQMKAITSGELMTAEEKFKPPFDFAPFSTMVFATNHLPHTRDFSKAMFRRAVIIEFTRSFKESEQDKGLGKKLVTELPGILNLALSAMKGVFLRGRFTEGESVARMKAEWRLQSDQAAQFVEECCEWVPNHRETSANLYNLYRAWAQSQGIMKTLNKANFTSRLTVLGAVLCRTSDWRGIAGLRLIKTVFDF